MLDNYQKDFPAPTQPVIDDMGRMTDAGQSFWLMLWNRTGKGTGVPIEVETGVVASGATQSTAYQLTRDWSDVATTAANAGVMLRNLKIGQSQLVYNGGGSALNVYPSGDANPPAAIDALGANAAFSLAAGKTQVFRAVSTTQLRTISWG